MVAEEQVEEDAAGLAAAAAAATRGFEVSQAAFAANVSLEHLEDEEVMSNGAHLLLLAVLCLLWLVRLMLLWSWIYSSGAAFACFCCSLLVWLDRAPCCHLRTVLSPAMPNGPP